MIVPVGPRSLNDELHRAHRGLVCTSFYRSLVGLSWYYQVVANTPRNYWMVSVRPEYYDICVEKNFSLLGMGKQQKKRAQRMEIGDRVLFYVAERMVFGATVSVADTYFEDENPIWPSIDPEEAFAWRVRTKPDVVLTEEYAIDCRLIAPRMEYVKKWAPEDWPLAFQGLLHLIPKKDFQLIEEEMRRGRKRPQIVLTPDPRHGPGAREAQHVSG